MRSRWEEKYGKEERADEPVTLTEGELRSLKRGAAFGVISAVVAIIALGVAGYTFVSARGITLDLLEGKSTSSTPAPSTSDSAAAGTASAPATAPTTAPAQPTTATQPTTTAAATQPATATAPAAKTVKPTPSVAQAPAATPHKAARVRSTPVPAVSAEKPVTIPATDIAPPSPIGADAAKPKPAVRDTAH